PRHSRRRRENQNAQHKKFHREENAGIEIKLKRRIAGDIEAHEREEGIPEGQEQTELQASQTLAVEKMANQRDRGSEESRYRENQPGGAPDPFVAWRLRGGRISCRR